MCTLLFFKYSIRELLGKDGLRCNICETECTDDKIRGRKISTLKKLAIGNFMYDNYLSTLKNYIYIYISYTLCSYFVEEHIWFSSKRYLLLENWKYIYNSRLC